MISFSHQLRTVLISILIVILDSCDTNGKLEFGEKRMIEFAGLAVHQSMAFYNDRAFFVTPINGELICDIYSISSGEFIQQVLFPINEYPLPHANTTCFGNQFYSTNSIAPTLYVSSWNYNRLAFVYDITFESGHYNGSLIQVIDPSEVNADILGAGCLDWLVDIENGDLYALAYHLEGTSREIVGNYTHITKFKLPSLDYAFVKLQDQDVVDSFDVPVMPVFQDKDINNGHIYVVAGIPDILNRFPPMIYDIDLANKQISESQLPYNGEPEGFCIYNDRKWLNMYGSTIVYNIDY